MIKRCLIVDTETTSLDPSTGSVIEIGAILYSVVNRTMLASYATLIPAEANEAEVINHIPAAALQEIKLLNEGDLGSPRDVFREFRRCSDAVVCHNVEFDRQWFRGEWLDLPWICTAFDFKWPSASREAASLVNLALDHGIGVGIAHRALNNCLLIAALFDRMPLFGCDLQQMFAHAMRPKGIFQALAPFEENDRVKAAGFKWNGESKRWTRRIAKEDAAALPFKTILLEDIA